MPGRTRLAGPAVTLALAASAAGCGGEDGGELIPQDSADAMLETAQRIEDATASQECPDAQAATTELRGQVEALPEETDPEIVDALDQMVSRLDDELNAECAETGTTETEEPEEPVEPVEPVEPTTTTTTTTTQPPEEEEEPEEEEAPPTGPPGQGGGQGPPVAPPGQAGGGPPTGGTEGDD